MYDLSVRCIHDTESIETFISEKLTPISDLSLVLEEPALLSSKLASGPWRVRLPRPNQTYLLTQSLDEIENYGEIVQFYVNSDENCLGYVIFKAFDGKSKMVKSQSKIGSVDFSQNLPREICNRAPQLFTKRDLIFRPNQESYVPVEVGENNFPPPCPTHFHGVHLMPSIVNFSIVQKDYYRFVMQKDFFIVLKNDSERFLFVKKGEHIATAFCRDGRYEEDFDRV